MTAVAKFLQGKVEDGLLKLVQPSALAPAFVFLLLNLAFVYPVLKSEGVAAATAFGELDEAWQVVGVVLLGGALGFLLHSFTGSVLDLLAGESWRDSALYPEADVRDEEAAQEGPERLERPPQGRQPGGAEQGVGHPRDVSGVRRDDHRHAS